MSTYAIRKTPGDWTGIDASGWHIIDVGTNESVGGGPFRDHLAASRRLVEIIARPLSDQCLVNTCLHDEVLHEDDSDGKSTCSACWFSTDERQNENARHTFRRYDP